jgi:tetratricopeptide (TPR) repeat protein
MSTGASLSALAAIGALIIALPCAALAAPLARQRLALLQEQSIGAAELTATPTPSPSPSPGAEASGEAVVTPSATPSPEQSPTASESEIFPAPTPMPTPAGESEPLGIGSLTPSPQVSDLPLDAIIAATADPARAASLRITEQARVALLAGRVDDAIRELSRAVSVDPNDPYAYFYLGRAYIAKNNLVQAITFLKRAEIGFGENPQWLGETLAFEGLAYEQGGHPNAAAGSYQQALQVEPGNLMARVGYTRVAPEITEPSRTPAEGAPEAGEAPPAPEESQAPLAPEEPTPAPAPAPTD